MAAMAELCRWGEVKTETCVAGGHKDQHGYWLAATWKIMPIVNISNKNCILFPILTHWSLYYFQHAILYSLFALWFTNNDWQKVSCLIIDKQFNSTESIIKQNQAADLRIFLTRKIHFVVLNAVGWSWNLCFIIAYGSNYFLLQSHNIIKHKFSLKMPFSLHQSTRLSPSASFSSYSSLLTYLMV